MDVSCGGPVSNTCLVYVTQALVPAQLHESAEHQAVIPDRIGDPPAISQSPPRWESGPSYEEALASASGPEKAAADLLPSDATFDPDTHEGAGMNILLCCVCCTALHSMVGMRFLSDLGVRERGIYKLPAATHCAA